MNKGSSHDSAAFAGSKLLDLLKEKAHHLKREGLFLNGDSAYPLYSFLQVPYDQVEAQDDPVGAKDAFNYYHSANRIWIECAFGEFIMRWGMFWRTLRFDSVFKSGQVIHAAMLLHNFIIEARMAEDQEADTTHFRSFSTNTDSRVQANMTELTNETPRAVVTDTNEPQPPGRRTISENKLMEEGALLCNSIMLSVARGNLKRPTKSGMCYNDEGLMYIYDILRCISVANAVFKIIS